MTSAQELVEEARDVHCPNCNILLYNTADLNDPERLNENVERLSLGDKWVVRCRSCRTTLCYPVHRHDLN